MNVVFVCSYDVDSVRSSYSQKMMCHSSAGILLVYLFWGCCSLVSPHFHQMMGICWSILEVFSIHLPAELHLGYRRRLRDRQYDWNDNLIASLNKGKVQGRARWLVEPLKRPFFGEGTQRNIATKKHNVLCKPILPVLIDARTPAESRSLGRAWDV